ncbi:MAG: hypothetical protein Q8Q35_04150 [Nanoarchaeota archaeon]|nr:hypothetical protein [Nanoarchaeota archaeon]
MSINNLKLSVKRLQDAIRGTGYHTSRDKFGLRLQGYESRTKTSIVSIEKYFWESIDKFKTDKERLEFSLLVGKLKDAKDVNVLIDTTEDMKDILDTYREEMDLNFKLPKLPEDVGEEMLMDIKELEKCYHNKCYRSCVIICGRLIELALHRKYYEHTGQDILEKSPGIGLGKLIAKMAEKDIDLDPGLSQQIHLINNIRTFSVHKKKIPFSPSRSQTQGIILFTLDILRKIF